MEKPVHTSQCNTRERETETRGTLRECRDDAREILIAVLYAQRLCGAPQASLAPTTLHYLQVRDLGDYVIQKKINVAEKQAPISQVALGLDSL